MPSISDPKLQAPPGDLRLAPQPSPPATDAQQDDDDPWAGLDSRQLRYLGYRALEATPGQALAACNVSSDELMAWRRQGTFAQHEARLITQAHHLGALGRRLLRQAAVKAALTLTDAMEQADDWGDRIRAADSILDRTPETAKAGKTGAITVEGNAIINLGNITTLTPPAHQS